VGELKMMEQIRKQTILIVDDEPGNIKILMELLKSDYQIRVANNGANALQIASSGDQPDLILLDIIMPGIDGYEVCKRLKADQHTQNIPVIFITAKGEVDDETRGFELGAVDYIAKPFKPVVVRARVKAHAELKQNRDFLEWMLKQRTQEIQQMEEEYLQLFYRK
jgi:putative two-component system response regulator